jgi:hypothetical protein
MSEENMKDIKDILKSIPNDVKDFHKFLRNIPLEWFMTHLFACSLLSDAVSIWKLYSSSLISLSEHM